MAELKEETLVDSTLRMVVSNIQIDFLLYYNFFLGWNIGLFKGHYDTKTM